MGLQNTPADVVVLCLTDGRVRDATCMQAGSSVCLRFVDPKCIQPNKHEMQSLLEEKESYKQLSPGAKSQCRFGINVTGLPEIFPCIGTNFQCSNLSAKFRYKRPLFAGNVWMY